MDYFDFFILAVTVASIGALIHLVLDAHGFFDDRRAQREKERQEKESKET